MNKEKQGMGELVSWVLLIGFAVALAGVVGFWMKSYSQGATEDLIDAKETDLRCNDVTFNAKLNCTKVPEELIVTNTGKFTILKLRTRQASLGNDELDLQGLEPAKTKTEVLNSFDPLEPIDFIPVITIEGKEVLCNTRRVTTQC